MTLPATITDREISLATEMAQRYQLGSLGSLIDSSRALTERDELTIAVIGRFKAGKSSFLNHFLGRDLLPVGVTPVTTVVTEIGYGERAKALVHLLDGHTREVAVNEIHQFISERDNPDNEKHVSVVQVTLPELATMRALHFVDMPGLESALAHNTEATLSWLPNVALALVAVSVDPPLSQHDIDLLQRIYKYTPNVSILLTKVDLVSETERAEIISFIKDRLSKTFDTAPSIFAYSVRTGFEDLRELIQETLISGTLARLEEQRDAVLSRKLQTLLGECRDYLVLALKSAEMMGSERETFERQVTAEKEALNETKSELRLVVRQAAGSVRETVAKRLEGHKSEIDVRLCSELNAKFLEWRSSLSYALGAFEQWLRDSLSREMMSISAEERSELLAPLERVRRQVFRSLQNFRDRLSDRTERVFGVPLRTTESDIVIDEPRVPDIYIGKVFDRNWELLSLAVPMSVFGSVVRRHFLNTLPRMTEKNVSRLASQWDESIRAAMMQILSEAERRLDELIATVERLLRTGGDEAPRIRADIERIDSCLTELAKSFPAIQGTAPGIEGNALSDSDRYSRQHRRPRSY